MTISVGGRDICGNCVLDTEAKCGICPVIARRRETVAPIIGNIEDQQRFRNHVRDVGHHSVQSLLDKAFLLRDGTVHPLRCSLWYKLAEEQGRSAVDGALWGIAKRSIRLGDHDAAANRDSNSER